MNIWKEYARRYPDDDLDVDGIVDERCWRRQKIKLLFVLKETNDLEGSLVEFLHSGAPEGGRNTWQPACKWVEAVLDGTEDGGYGTAEEREPMLRRIATMNLKKVSGGATSDYGYVQWAKGNVDLLQRQVKDINPDVILLCCDEAGNTFFTEEVLEGVDWKKFQSTDLWYASWKGKTVLWARHPLFAPTSWRDAFAAYHQSFLA